MIFSKLIKEQKAKARTSDSADERATHTETEGIELSDEQIEALTGGIHIRADLSTTQK